MARLLVRALELAGHRVELASRFRSWEGRGDAPRQARLERIGTRLAERLLRRYGRGERPDLWFSYHVYHKAPDWIGPRVTGGLAIPYVIAEASYAPKQEDGRWRDGHRASARAIGRAAAVLALNRVDIECIRPLLRPDARMLHLRPFLDEPIRPPPSPREAQRRELASRHRLDPGVPWLLTVAMMRFGDKLESYRRLAAALRQSLATAWQLVVVGDGAARAEVQALFEGFGPGRVRFVGRQGPQPLGCFYAGCDLLVWPAVNEAYGMALLEAQAAGLAVVAGRCGGVAEVVDHGRSGLLVPEAAPAGISAAVLELLADPRRRRAMGARAVRRAAREHSLGGASAALDTLICGLRP